MFRINAIALIGLLIVHLLEKVTISIIGRFLRSSIYYFSRSNPR
jgi:hypothetical protein